LHKEQTKLQQTGQHFTHYKTNTKKKELKATAKKMKRNIRLTAAYKNTKTVGTRQ
jgi:hypothetical protein